MLIMRIRDLQKETWQETWAKYYNHRPFPTPGPYIREKILMALACQYQAVDMDVVSSWLKDNGFPDYLYLTPIEADKITRDVIEATERQEN